MQQKIKPLEEKLAKDGRQAYTMRSAVEILGDRVAGMKMGDLAEDLLPLFEQRSFIQAWLEAFKENFTEYSKAYMG